VVYDKRSATFYRDHASLSTVAGRIDCEFVLPSGSPTPYERYVLPEEFEFRMATLQYDRATDALYLHIGTRAYEPDEENDGDDTDDTADAENHSVLGVDLGVKNIAVASTGRFWSAGEFNHRRREFEKRRGGMQQCGTQAAHNAMQRLGDREEAWYKQHLHTIANELVAEAVEHGCEVIVFEDLTDIRENIPYAKWQHVWAFRRLYGYVEYKAAMHDVRTKQVPPNHTSRRCSKCGFTAEANRDGDDFECRSCGYELHADYNASKNIGLRYVRREYHRLRSGQKSPGGDAPVNVRLNRGAMTDDGPQASASD
jgi:IS605 OrfB family transposase